MDAIQIVLGVILIVVSVVIIILVMAQDSKAELSSAIGGGSSAADSFFGKNKGRTKESQFRKLTVIFAAAFGVLSLISSLLFLFFAN